MHRRTGFALYPDLLRAGALPIQPYSLSVVIYWYSGAISPGRSSSAASVRDALSGRGLNAPAPGEPTANCTFRLVAIAPATAQVRFRAANADLA